MAAPRLPCRPSSRLRFPGSAGSGGGVFPDCAALGHKEGLVKLSPKHIGCVGFTAHGQQFVNIPIDGWPSQSNHNLARCPGQASVEVPNLSAPGLANALTSAAAQLDANSKGPNEV